MYPGSSIHSGRIGVISPVAHKYGKSSYTELDATAIFSYFFPVMIIIWGLYVM